MASTLAVPPQTRVNRDVPTHRWRYLVLCVLCMILIANLQYGWSVFVQPIQTRFGWSLSDIQFSFTLFVALETWGTPINGMIADHLGFRLGPRVVIGVGGVLIALGWIIDAYTTTLWALYLGGILTGFGSGAVYCTGVGTTVKWFNDKRGLAVGLVAGGFGAGTALTIIPIRMVIERFSYMDAFLWFGLLQGVLVLILAQFIRSPAPGEAPEGKRANAMQTSRSYTPHEMLVSKAFWVLFILDVLMCAGGLIVTGYLAPIVTAYHLTNTVVLWGAGTLSVALIIANIMNGVARPFFGWVSDVIGLWQTMAIAFLLGAVSYYCLYLFGSNPWGLILSVGMIFFCWGEIFSLFPAMCTDMFGPNYATSNTSILYTAKGVAAFLVPVGGWLSEATGSWNDLLFIVAGVNILATVLVLVVLRPAVKAHHDEDVRAVKLATAPAVTHA